MLVNGSIYSCPKPQRHHNVIHLVFKTTGLKSLGLNCQGFLLNDGTFASREIAYEIAVKNGQLISSHTPGVLFSEDLW